MLDIKTAMIVSKAINEYFFPSNSNRLVSLETVCRMQPVVQSADGDYTILALQYGDLTILVWVQISEEHGVMVRSVKVQKW